MNKDYNNYQKNWRKNNPEKHKQYLSKWRRENPKKYKLYHDKWTKENPDKMKEYSAKYRRENPAKRKESIKKWIKNNPEIYKKRCRKYSLKRKYNITPEYYDKLLIKQNNKCAVCGVNQEDYYKILAVDHNHKTGKVRGLLCENCNRGIGLFKDDINTLFKVIKYLEKMD